MIWHIAGIDQMKWIGGVILLIVTITLLVVAIFMFPWFSTKTNYERERINDVQPDYWEDNMGGMERDWDESTFYLQQYELKTSRPWDWGKNGSRESASSGMLQYNAAPEAGGWEGSYRSQVEAGYPKPGFLAGGNEQLAVYNFTYYMVLFAIILACVGIVFIILAGLEKMNAVVAKVLVGVIIVIVILAPLYFALALPPAIETDHNQLKKVDPSFQNNTKRPPEAGGIMGKANEKDDASGGITSTTEFAPGIGWWLSIVAIFTTIITLGFVTGPGAASSARPDYSRKKYHEFDDVYDDQYRYDTGRDHGQPSRRADEQYYEDDYHDRGRLRERDQYYDDYDRGGHPPMRSPGPQGRAPPPTQQYDYGRPAPRPPRRQPGTRPGPRGRAPPPRRRPGRRPPPGY